MTTTTTCPSCGAPGSGQFCANCGAALGAATCASCGAALSPGAKFCHRCGTPVGAAGVRPAAGPTGRGAGSSLPWAVAAIALLALISLAAGQRFNRAPGGTLDAPSNALPQAGLGEGPMGQGAPGLAGAGDPAAAGRAPDISSLSADERATRLFDRIVRLDEEGKRDSVQFFAPMALASFRGIASPNTDQRYDLGRIGEVTGDYGTAKAQADTILKGNPTHLLALALRARMSADPKERADYERRLLAAEPAERAKGLPEYQAHAADLQRAIAEARKGAK
jgi:hypothetical protein